MDGRWDDFIRSVVINCFIIVFIDGYFFIFKNVLFDCDMIICIIDMVKGGVVYENDIFEV